MKKYSNPLKDPFLKREADKYEMPVPSREYILMTLKSLKHPQKAKHLAKHYEIHDPSALDALKRRLKAMVRDGQLMKTHSGFAPIETLEEVQGTLVLTKDGEGVCVTEDNQTIRMPERSLRGFYEGDQVQIQVKQFFDTHEKVGFVQKLLKASEPTVVGRLIQHGKLFKVQSLDRKMTRPIIIPKLHKKKAKDGDIVLVKILREEKYQSHYEAVGEIVEVMGDFATAGIEIEMAIRKFHLPHQWSEPVQKAAQKLPKQVTPQSKNNREDLTGLAFVTIDGEDAKDFDDAVYCEETTTGWRLWVAIADVSYYVKKNSVLDKEARNRGNSTYFPNAVIPMLPEALSNELCSLRPHEDRLTMVCQMTVNQQGRVTRSQFSRAVIHSQARLTYTKVAKIYDEDTTLSQEHKKLLPSLRALLAVYKALSSERIQRGALDLDTVENQILFDEQGKIEKILPVTRNVAHKVIEECMLAANVSAARLILRHKKPGLFRVHDRPPKEKLTQLRAFLQELGLSLGGKDRPEPKHFADLLSEAKGRPDRHLIETVILRSLSQAQYRPENVGHFGLAYPFYVHFTSPIRRYPDLIIHRILLEIIEGGSKPTYDSEGLEKLGLHLSKTERRSDEATRDAVYALKCHFMQDKIGEVYEGVISGVTHFGVFVELKEIFIEGLIHVSQLGHEYFYFDPVKHWMIGEHSRRIYQLGQTVKVKVVRVDLEMKKIDFDLVETESALPKQSRQNKNKPQGKIKENPKKQKRKKK